MSNLLRVMYWHPCHGSRELLSAGWAGISALLTRHAERARAAGVRLEGWCHDNPFQKWWNEAARDPNSPTTCFDQFTRCRQGPLPIHRAIANIAAWWAAEQRIATAFEVNGHGTAAEVYGGPSWAGIEGGEIADAMLPFMGKRRYVHWNDGAADLSRQDQDFAVMSMQRMCNIEPGVEAIPVPSSIFNRQNVRAFAVYATAIKAPPVQCPLSVLYRGATEEAPTFPNGSRGEPVPLETAIEWCKSKDATLYVNIGLCSASQLATLAGAQSGTATPNPPTTEPA